MPTDFRPHFCFFAGLPFRQLLRGRTGAMVDLLVKRGHPMAFFEYPPVGLREMLHRDINSTHTWPEYLAHRVNWQQNLVVVPQIPPFPFSRHSRLIRDWNYRRQTRWYHSSIQRCIAPTNRPSVAIVNIPWWRQFLRRGDFDILCYDLIDDPIVFCDPTQYDKFLQWETELVAESQIVTYSADALGSKAARNPHARLVHLPNGVDSAWFRNRAAVLPVPEDVSRIPAPRAGSVGSIFHWTDIDLAARVIGALPDISFVFVGPLGHPSIINPLLRLRNFHYLGPKPYNLVPAYINSFDICLSFFKRDRLSDAVDPVKVYEYLALGKPVVASFIPEMAKFGELVRTATDAESFCAQVRATLVDRDPELRVKRQAYADASSWSRRIDELLAAIQEVWAQR
jgi:glycosyltransferase involved in cell wall biosynthesis